MIGRPFFLTQSRRGMDHAIITIFVLSLRFTVNDCLSIHAVQDEYLPSMGSRHLLSNIFVQDETITKEYRDDTWTTTLTTEFFSGLSRSKMMGGKGSSKSKLAPTVSKMPSPSLSSKSKGMKDMSDEEDCVSSKMGRMSKSNSKRMGKGKGKGKRKSCAPTMAPTTTTLPTVTPTVPSTVPFFGTATPTLPATTTTTPTIPSQITATPTVSPKVITTAPVLVAPVPINVPLVTPVIPPSTTPAPTIPPVIISTPSTVPSIFPVFPVFSTSPGSPSPSSSTTLLPAPTTMAPTGATGTASPFRLTYVLTDSAQPNDAQYTAAADIALANIEAFVRNQFSFAFGIEVDMFNGMVTTTGFNPVTIDFTVFVSFTNDSSFIPTTSEVDALIELALLPPNVDTLIAEYNALPTDTPFSSSQSVTYQAL